MATDLGRAKSMPASKYDAFVSAQLARAEGRIRLLDLTAGLLGFAALSLAYVVGMVLCDSKLMLSQQTRQLSLYVFLAGGAVYLFFAVLRPLRLRVNPYFAARQVEQQLPHAKNSIINWVDLHEQQLLPAIRGALGQRAAKDLSRVDLDRAISGRRAAWMAGLAGLFLLAFITSFFLLGPAPFLSLLKRTFNPFGVVGVSTRTQLTLLKPEGGNATVTVGRGVNFVVEVNGKVPDPKAPDAVKLLYRYEESDPWLERLLIQEPSREWTTSLSAIEVGNGFWYKITGGDAATKEYRVSVRAAPAITDFLATYRFRPYVARADEVRRERELKELRGTEILLRVRTNRTLRGGELELEGKKGVRGEVDPNNPHTLLVPFVLDEDGKYRLRFTSTEGEAYIDPVAYPVTVIPDKPPVVELTKPGEDIRLPADALLHLEGKASDDIGVKGLTLRMRVVGGDKLRGQPYRSDEELRLADGGYPRELEYQDFVELSRVKSEDGQAVPLRAGMELEYWLEASDACDYPHANVTESKHYRVLLTEPEKNEQKRRQEKQQANKDKQQHEQKQDQKFQKENQQRQQQRQEQEAHNKEEENKSKDADKGAGVEPSQQKEGEQANNGESKGGKGQQGESKDGSGEQNNGEQKGESSKEDQNIEEQIKKALERKEASEDAKSEDKPDKGEGKGAQSSKSESGAGAGGKSEGESKGADKQDAKEAGQGKDKGQPQAGADPSQGDGKGDNQAGPMPGDKSEPKDGDPMKQNGAAKAGEGKGKPDAAPKPGEDKDNPNAVPQSGQGKPSGDPQASKDAAPDKPQPRGKDQKAATGESKPADGKEQKAERESAGEAKDKKSSVSRGKAKDDRKTEAKQGNSSAKGEQSAAGDAKPSTGQDKDRDAASESKPADGKEQKSEREGEAKDKKSSASRGEAKDEGERKDGRKTEAKQGDSSAKGEQSPAGDAKPSARQDKDERAAKSESKPDPDAQARNATAKDIQDLARSLEGKDPREREKAKQQLERIEKQAANAEARTKASETLEKFGAPDGSNENRNPTDGNASSAEPKNGGNDRDSSQRNGSLKPEKSGAKGTDIGEKNSSGSAVEPKDERKDSDGSQGSGSSGPKEGGKGTRPGEKNSRGSAAGPKNEPKEGKGPKSSGSSGSKDGDKGTGSSQKNGQSGKNGQGSSSSGTSSQSQSSQSGNQTGGGGERRSGEGDAGSHGEALPDKSRPAKPRDHRAAQMQLEDFAKKVNKDILKDAGVSEEAWQKYLESKRKQLAPRDKPRPDTPGTPQQENQLPSMGGQTIKPSASGQGDVHGPDRGQPPPGYRDPFREFTRQMSKSK